MSLKFSNKKSLLSDQILRVVFVSVLISVVINFVINKYYFSTNSSDVASYIEENPMHIVESINNHYAKQQRSKTEDRGKNLKDNIDKVINYSKDPVAGKKDSKKIVVEFFDYNCGYCKKAFNESIAKLLVEDKDVKVIFKEMPILGKLSEIKSRLSIAANLIDNSKYLGVHSKLMQAAPTLNTIELLAESLTGLGYKKDKLIKKAQSDEVSDIIEYNRSLGIDLGINGTPAFIVGEEFIDGFVSAEVLKSKLK